MVSTAALLLFFFFIFAIAGLQLWMGVLRNRCINIDTGHVSDELCGFEECQINFECVSSLDNPNLGVTSFDNILLSFLAVF